MIITGAFESFDGLIIVPLEDNRYHSPHFFNCKSFGIAIILVKLEKGVNFHNNNEEEKERKGIVGKILDEVPCSTTT
jgi:hypothetical protein